MSFSSCLMLGNLPEEEFPELFRFVSQMDDPAALLADDRESSLADADDQLGALDGVIPGGHDVHLDRKRFDSIHARNKKIGNFTLTVVFVADPSVPQ